MKIGVRAELPYQKKPTLILTMPSSAFSLMSAKVNKFDGGPDFFKIHSKIVSLVSPPVNFILFPIKNRKGLRNLECHISQPILCFMWCLVL